MADWNNENVKKPVMEKQNSMKSILKTLKKLRSRLELFKNISILEQNKAYR